MAKIETPEYTNYGKIARKLFFNNYSWFTIVKRK